MKLRLTLTPSDVICLDSLTECQSNRVTEPVAFTRAQLKRQLERSLAMEGEDAND
jgi:hypothetical protein